MTSVARKTSASFTLAPSITYDCTPFFFFFNDPPPPEIYTLPLPDALPISPSSRRSWSIIRNEFCLFDFSSRKETPDDPRHRIRPAPCALSRIRPAVSQPAGEADRGVPAGRSEEHTSELQSQSNLVCRLLLE